MKLHELQNKFIYNILTSTHVFVNDPTRGYGIGIDKMTNSY
ncbi:MAG: hypothetical protein J1F61_04875 [Clostridiales bacterium]|nr:hypothetical protein [Clostridiales bacterium]